MKPQDPTRTSSGWKPTEPEHQPRKREQPHGCRHEQPVQPEQRTHLWWRRKRNEKSEREKSETYRKPPYGLLL